MTKFENWCYNHADEMLMGISSIRCCRDVTGMEIEFHIRAAYDGFSGTRYRVAITEMLIVATNYWAWMHEAKKPHELVATLHSLRMRIIGRKPVPKQ
jgi:hypothetical protein